jgi:hypothetical protein
LEKILNPLDLYGMEILKSGNIKKLQIKKNEDKPLGFPNSKHLSAAGWAFAFCSWLAIF